VIQGVFIPIGTRGEYSINLPFGSLGYLNGYMIGWRITQIGATLELNMPNADKVDQMFQALNDAEEREEREPWDPKIVKVMPEACANCLLGPDPLVGTEVIEDILAQIAGVGTFTCHLSTIAGRPRCCFTFFQEGRSLVARLAKHGGWFAYVPIGHN